jgi:hypothetical protein
MTMGENHNKARCRVKQEERDRSSLHHGLLAPNDEIGEAR